MNLTEMNVTKLKELAKKYNIENYNSMVKSDLVTNLHAEIAKVEENRIVAFGKLEILPDGYEF